MRDGLAVTSGTIITCCLPPSASTSSLCWSCVGCTIASSAWLVYRYLIRRETNELYIPFVSYAPQNIKTVLEFPLSLTVFLPQVRRIRAATPSITRSSTSLRGATLREHKATMMLAAVLGVFIFCWLPYIVFFTCMGLRRETEPPQVVHSVVLCLGYFNSALNPILYPALNRDFRHAYGHLLHCRNPHKNTFMSIRTSGKDRSVLSDEFQSENKCNKSSMEMRLHQEEINDDAGPEHTN